MRYYCTKTYGTETGLSCVFRQWRADHSHCSKLHGYSLGFEITFSCKELDSKNWVMDFGSLKPVKKMLHYLFDHTLIIAKDDPKKDTLQNLTHVADLRYLPNVGCEKFAETVFNQVESILQMLKNEDQEGAINKTVEVYSVTCFEHAGNSATVKRTRL